MAIAEPISARRSKLLARARWVDQRRAPKLTTDMKTRRLVTEYIMGRKGAKAPMLTLANMVAPEKQKPKMPTPMNATATSRIAEGCALD